MSSFEKSVPEAVLLTAAQMRAAEACAIAAGVTTGLRMMERAGAGVVAAIEARWPDYGRAPGRAVVLCGPGNNGGDGFVVARLLAQRGWGVEVLALDTAAGARDAVEMRAQWAAIGGIGALSYDAFRALGEADLYVDALFGTGLTRPVDGEVGKILRFMAGDGGEPGTFRARTVAVDLPSGLCADSGRVLDPLGTNAPYAALTVTFHRAKLGHVLSHGPELCGALEVVDIGLDSPAARRARTPLTSSGAALAPMVRQVVAPERWIASKRSGGHKFSHGHALVLSGGPGRTGAARLAARAALRIGAGLVTLGVPPSAQMEVAAHITAVMLTRVPDAAALAEVLADDRITALCLGPGMGLDAPEAALVAAALESGRPCVLDADALTLVAQDAALRRLLHEDCLLTPHLGEFARLCPEIAAKLAAPGARGPLYSRVDAARDAARVLGATVLLKGPGTVIATPQGQVAVHGAAYGREAPWLATAGAGDVLAGLAAGLMARGAGAFAAAQSAAWLHVEAARRFGPGLIAEDLPEQIPGVLSSLRA